MSRSAGGSSGGSGGLRITPTPTDEEVAAIVAAIDVTTGRAAGGASGDVEVPRWRWSGRWWSKPVPARRVRPW